MTRIMRSVGYFSLPHCLRSFAISPTKLDLDFATRLPNLLKPPLHYSSQSILLVPVTSVNLFTQYAQEVGLPSIWKLSNAL
jgi:hypothetical protein